MTLMSFGNMACRGSIHGRGSAETRPKRFLVIQSANLELAQEWEHANPVS